MTHLVWDWNGTLLDDLALTITATNASLAAVGGPVVTVQQHRVAFRRPLADYYAEMLGRHVTPYEFAYLDSVFQETYRAGVASCELAADALEAMKVWSGLVVGMGDFGTQSLLSMCSHSDLVGELRRRGLVEWLLRVDGRRGDDLPDRKVGHLVKHLGSLGLTGADCVLVGDSVDDADAAAATGARCVLYSGGVTDERVLRATGCPVASTLVAAVRIAGMPGLPVPGGAACRREEDPAS